MQFIIVLHTKSMKNHWCGICDICMSFIPLCHSSTCIVPYTEYNQLFLYTVFIDTRIRTEQSVNEEDFSAPVAVGHTVCACAHAHVFVCVCVDCSQLLNINLKVKGRELFDIHAGCCTLCLVLEPYPRCCFSHWLTGSFCLLLFLPFLPLMCWHIIEPDCVCSQIQNICSHLKALHALQQFNTEASISHGGTKASETNMFCAAAMTSGFQIFSPSAESESLICIIYRGETDPRKRRSH